MKRAWAVAAVFAAAMVIAGADEAWMTTPGAHPAMKNFEGELGALFTNGPDARLRVTELGFVDAAGYGLLRAHAVRLLSNGVELARVIIPRGTGARLEDGFRYVKLTNEVVLVPGQAYVLAASVSRKNGDIWRGYAGGRAENPTYTRRVLPPVPVFVMGEAYGFLDGAFQANTNGYEYPETFVGPNFKFEPLPAAKPPARAF